jgi:hypothetical protein
MKGLQPLFFGIFGIFAFSWLGMTVVPNLQIGSLNPQTDEDGGDVYPAPPSGMAIRGCGSLRRERLCLLSFATSAARLRWLGSRAEMG